MTINEIKIVFKRNFQKIVTFFVKKINEITLIASVLRFCLNRRSQSMHRLRPPASVGRHGSNVLLTRLNPSKHTSIMKLPGRLKPCLNVADPARIWVVVLRASSRSRSGLLDEVSCFLQSPRMGAVEYDLLADPVHVFAMSLASTREKECVEVKARWGHQRSCNACTAGWSQILG